MKSVIKFFAALAGVLIAFWGIARLYDAVLANGDGILGRVNLDVLLSYLLTLLGLLTATLLGTKSRHGWVAGTSASLCGLLLFWILAEVVCFGLVRTGLSDAPRPLHTRMWINDNWYAYQPPFWGDISPAFGRWRIPNGSLSLPLCTGDTVLLTSNRFGMRDRERTLRNASGQKRALFIGDSFVEGFLVNEPQRYSNLLEARTGREHLNFGINGTSPIDYYLTYQGLARRFDYDLLIVSLLPANDFDRYEEDQKPDLLRYPIYRPFWRGQFPKVKLAYSLADIGQSIATPANYQQPIRVQRTVDSLYHTLPWARRKTADFQLNSYLYSCITFWANQSLDASPVFHNSYSKAYFGDRWPPMAYSLDKLLKAAQGKRIIVMGMPILDDLKAYDQDRKDDLSILIRQSCKRHGATYFNLLPEFHALGADHWQDLYVPCDGHFTPESERQVARLLLNNLDYRRAMEIDRP